MQQLEVRLEMMREGAGRQVPDVPVGAGREIAAQPLDRRRDLQRAAPGGALVEQGGGERREPRPPWRVVVGPGRRYELQATSGTSLRRAANTVRPLASRWRTNDGNLNRRYLPGAGGSDRSSGPGRPLIAAPR